MESIIKAVSVVILGFITLFTGAVIAGTIVWMLWEDNIPYFFPHLVKAGLPIEPEWWKCVMLSWITGALFKSSNTSKE